MVLKEVAYRDVLARIQIFSCRLTASGTGERQGGRRVGGGKDGRGEMQDIKNKTWLWITHMLMES